MRSAAAPWPNSGPRTRNDGSSAVVRLAGSVSTAASGHVAAQGDEDRRDADDGDVDQAHDERLRPREQSVVTASDPLPVIRPALTALNTVKGSQRPIAGLRATMMLSTASAQIRTPATVTTWARNKAPRATPKVVMRPATTICLA